MREFELNTRKPKKPKKYKPDQVNSSDEIPQYNSSTSDFSQHVIKFISDVLFEEEMEDTYRCCKTL